MEGSAQQASTSRTEFASTERQDRIPRGRMDKKRMMELVNAVVLPGYKQDQDGDELSGKPAHERFAMAACGSWKGSTTSGFTRLTEQRKKADVASQYESVQAYQCASCKRNLAAGLAIRPPFENLRVYRRTSAVPPLPGHEDEDLVAVYSQTHADHLQRAGYKAVKLHHYQPERPLPSELVPLTSASSTGKRRKRPSVEDSTGAAHSAHKGSQPQAQPTCAPATDACKSRADSSTPKQPPPPPAPHSPTTSSPALDRLVMPDMCPVWHSMHDLFNMMENPFYTYVDGERKGPFTPVYLWPHGPSGKNAKQRFGVSWQQADTQQALAYLYQDYYHLKVREPEVSKWIKDNGLFRDCESPLTTNPLPLGVKSIWRQNRANFPRPDKKKSWAHLVVDHLRGNLYGFQEPDVFNKSTK